MKKKVYNVLLIIAIIFAFLCFVFNLIMLIDFADKTVQSVSVMDLFYKNIGNRMNVQIRPEFIYFSIFSTLFSLFTLVFLIIIGIKINRAELSYTKDEIAAKVAAMKKARQERKESKQHEKEEQKKADLQRQLDELNKKDGE